MLARQGVTLLSEGENDAVVRSESTVGEARHSLSNLGVR